MKAPEPISPAHIVREFKCSHDSLNVWLHERALKNELIGASRTFVICLPETKRVIGYYCLSQGAIGHELLSAKDKRNMPDPLPATILGRLAIDKDWAGKGLGTVLLQDAIRRSKQASLQAASKGVFVQALDENAANFYVKFGFKILPTDPLYLILSLT
jgi:GNAT superfamily N-acetyltransferase